MSLSLPLSIYTSLSHCVYCERDRECMSHLFSPLSANSYISSFFSPHSHSRSFFLLPSSLLFSHRERIRYTESGREWGREGGKEKDRDRQTDRVREEGGRREGEKRKKQRERQRLGESLCFYLYPLPPSPSLPPSLSSLCISPTLSVTLLSQSSLFYPPYISYIFTGS